MSKFEIVTYWGWGSGNSYQFAGASLFINKSEKRRIVQKSNANSQYALAYMCIEEILKSDEGQIDNVVIIEQSILGLRGNGKGKMHNYVKNLKENYLNRIKWQVKNDTQRCQKIREQIIKFLPELDEDTFCELPIQKLSTQKKSTVTQPHNESTAKMTSVFQKGLHSNATTWSQSEQVVSANGNSEERTKGGSTKKAEKDKLKYAYFSDLQKRFKKKIEKEAPETQKYYIEALSYLAMGCVLETTRKFKKLDKPIGAEDFRAIADNLEYSLLKKTVKCLMKNKPQNPAFYSLAIFADALLRIDNSEDISSVLPTDIEPKTTKVMAKYEAYQPKKHSSNNQSKTDYTAYGSRYIKVDDRRGQVILAQFDRLPEDIKQEIYDFYKDKADIDLFLANNWTD